ncbi:acyltransferase [Natronomonas salina]|uniref:acyltransferase n=1 Tax=Natronomonas salina TaxID=1710540 RepID=UPI0015B4FB64|nr:acyltransferase [Natronomonas salina]QLD88723.1 acyltransferase [Natronomonas salina]
MTERIHSIDATRIVAMAFVVAIHTDPFRGLGAYGNLANFAIDSTARFAVPFFFLTSGYLFAAKTADRNTRQFLVEQVRTLASLYVFGLLLAAPVFLAGALADRGADAGSVVRTGTQELAGFVSPLELLYFGNSVSEILWFLPALGYSLVLIYGFDRVDGTRYLLPVSLGLHVVGLLASSYGLFLDVPIEHRDALFFGFFYTSLGYHLGASDWRPDADRSTLYLGAAGAFAALNVVERYVLGYVLTGETVTQGVYTASYTIGTALFSIALFLFLLARPGLGQHTALPSWGKSAVGIYVVHPALLYPLERSGTALRLLGVDGSESVLWHLLLTPTVFFGSWLVYVAVRELGAIQDGQVRLPDAWSVRSADSE